MPVPLQVSLDSCGVTVGAFVPPDDDPHTIKYLVRRDWVGTLIGGGRTHFRAAPVNVGGHFRDCLQKVSNLARRVHQGQLEPSLCDENYLDIRWCLVSSIGGT